MLDASIAARRFICCPSLSSYEIIEAHNNFVKQTLKQVAFDQQLLSDLGVNKNVEILVKVQVQRTNLAGKFADYGCKEYSQGTSEYPVLCSKKTFPELVLFIPSLLCTFVKLPLACMHFERNAVRIGLNRWQICNIRLTY